MLLRGEADAYVHQVGLKEWDTCAPEAVPAPLVAQLKDGGRMIIPVGTSWNQQLVLLRKQGEKLEKRAVLPVIFVPMTGEARKSRD